MQDYFIKAATKEEFNTKLIEAGVLVLSPATSQTTPEETIDTPESVSVAEGLALDEIGIISKPTGVILTSEEGIEYPEYAPVPGYHGNLRGVLTEEQETVLAPVLLETAPSNPARVWA